MTGEQERLFEYGVLLVAVIAGLVIMLLMFNHCP